VSDQFVAEIRIFPFNFAPQGWAICQGQLLPISQNTALFSLIGTFYGGNGTSNFALPNLQGVAAAQAGQGVGLTSVEQGELDLNNRNRALPTSVTVARQMLSSTTAGSALAAFPAEPSLAINYCIALTGIFPSRS